MRLARPVSLLAAAAIMLAACGGGTVAPPAPVAVQPKDGGTLRVGTSAEVFTMDLANNQSAQELLVGSLAYERLVYYDKDGKLQPGLATSWTTPDPLTYVFLLRQGVKFHDGTPWNAANAKMYFDRAVTQKNARLYDMPASITAEGEYQLTFKLRRAFVPFLSALAHGGTSLQSPASITKYGKDLGNYAVGTGPFKLTEWVRGGNMTFERNTEYWGPKPRLDKIIVRYIADDNTRMAALDAGEIDVAQNVPPSRVPDLKTSKTLSLQQGALIGNYSLGQTYTYGPLKDKRVRQAIAMAVDQKSLVENVLEGVVRPASSGFIPPELWTSPSTTKLLPYDVAKAKALLAEAGYASGFKIELNTANGNFLKDNEIAAAIQQMLKAINVDVTIKPLAYAAYLAYNTAHEGQLFLLGHSISTGTPDGYYRAVFYSKGTSFPNYKSQVADDLIDKAIGQPSIDAAEKVWRELDQYLIDDAIAVPIHYTNYLYASSKKVHEFFPSPRSTFDQSIITAWIE